MKHAVTELCDLTAAELGESLKSGRVSASEVTNAYLDRIERLNHLINAFITVRRTEALSEAREARDDIVAGRFRGPLHGIPLAVKDNVHTAGDLTTAGARILRDNVTPDDATIVTRLRRAGVILLGKLSLMEFAFGDDVNPLNGRGPTLNPWDRSRSVSGSSSGSAAALAAGLCTIAIGTDTGGSVRLPAAFCGVVGMKATFGRVSRKGVIPLAWSFDCVGPMTRSVKDNAMMLQIIAGHDREDPSSAYEPAGDYLSDLEAGVKGLRIGIPKRYFMEYSVPEVANAVTAAARQLEQLGARLYEIDSPHLRYAVGAWTTIALAEMSAYHQTYLRHGRFADYTQMNRINLDLAQSVTATDYVQAQRLRRFMMTDFEEVFRRVDVVITPAAPAEANPIEEDLVSRELPVRTPPAGATSLLEMTCRMTVPASLTGVPALAIPIGFSGSGLPLSAQLIGRWFGEETLYRAAYAYERVTNWHKQKPNL